MTLFTGVGAESLPSGMNELVPEHQKTMKLYVGNISFDATEQDIRAFFEEQGTVVDCYYPLDRDTGRPRGFAFVTYESKEVGKAALETLDGSDFQGRPLRVNEAHEKEKSGGGGGGGYRGGGGGGGYRGGGGGGRGGGGGGYRGGGGGGRGGGRDRRGGGGGRDRRGGGGGGGRDRRGGGGGGYDDWD